MLARAALHARRSLASRALATGAGPKEVFVVGVGMTKFEKPGAREDFDYPDMVREAGTKALTDAGGLSYELVEQVAVGYVYGPSTCGNRAAYELGLTGAPIYNVNNNCSTGSTALMLAAQLVQGGLAECTMALGFEKMQRGSLDLGAEDRENPVGRHMKKQVELTGKPTGPPAPWLFGAAGEFHMQKYGTTAEQIAMIAEKNHRHSANNPYAQFQDVYTLEEVMGSKPITGPLTMLQCSPTSDGGAAAVLASRAFVEAHGLWDRAVRIAGQAMATDLESTFSADATPISVVGGDMTRKAAGAALAQAGLSAADVQVVELHDCFSANELITYEALGLCAEGEAGDFVQRGDATYGGQYVVNPSGGLISKGHPLGATGLAQCAELTWQLRGEADARQVDGVEACLQHNLGLGGAAVVTVYTRP